MERVSPSRRLMHGCLLLPGGRTRPPFPPSGCCLPPARSATQRFPPAGLPPCGPKGITRCQSPRSVNSVPAPWCRRYPAALPAVPMAPGQELYDTVVLVPLLSFRGPEETEVGEGGDVVGFQYPDMNAISLDSRNAEQPFVADGGSLRDCFPLAINPCLYHES